MNSTTRNEHQFFCPKCRRLLPLSQFYQYKNGRRSGYCKRCTSMLTADRIRKKREDPVFRAKEAAQRRERYRNDEAFRQRVLKQMRKKREEQGYRTKEAARKRERYHTDEAFRERVLKLHREQYRRKQLPQVCTSCVNYPCFEGIENMSSNLALTCHSYKVG